MHEGRKNAIFHGYVRRATPIKRYKNVSNVEDLRDIPFYCHDYCGRCYGISLFVVLLAVKEDKEDMST